MLDKKLLPISSSTRRYWGEELLFYSGGKPSGKCVTRLSLVTRRCEEGVTTNLLRS
jgi:hypothetical protein